MNYEMYFSPTGGTKKVSKILSSNLFSNAREIDLSDNNLNLSEINLQSTDIVLISVPSFSGRVPVGICDKLKLIKGNNAKAIIVCVYGNRAYDDTMVELNDVLKNEFKIIAGVVAVAEHSIARIYAKGRPDLTDEQNLIKMAKKIKEKIDSNDNSCPKFNGNRPYKELSKSTFEIKTNEKCVSCSKCYKKCPTQAISKNDYAKIDFSKCIFCMRCISVCDFGAKYLDASVIEKVENALKKPCSIRKEAVLFL